MTAQQQLFLDYSKTVCGEPDLSPGLALIYFGIFDNDPKLQADFRSLLQRFQPIAGSTNPEQQITKQILQDPVAASTTLLIIKLWYLGFIPSLTANPTSPLSGGGYYFHHEALIWKIAQAHPAGLSGGYYGYWSYKPEN